MIVDKTKPKLTQKDSSEMNEITEDGLSEITNQLNDKNKIMSLSFLWQNNKIETKKEIFVDDESHQLEAKSLIKIIDALFDSVEPIYRTNNCILYEDKYDNLGVALRMLPILEMSALLLKEDKDFEFTYTTYDALLNDSKQTKVTVVESTIEKDEVPAPIALFLTLSYLKAIYELNDEESIEHFTDYLKNMR